VVRNGSNEERPEVGYLFEGMTLGVISAPKVIRSEQEQTSSLLFIAAVR
jgi:hypothetical protein